MKKFLIGLAMVMSLFGFSSCQNELHPPIKETQEIIQLVKTPDILTYSGDYIIGSTFDTRAINIPAKYNSNPNSNQWQNVPNEITDDEIIKVSKWFNEHQYPESLELNWTNFYVQFVYGQHENMDQLVVNTNDHVNNFNANKGSIMLMENTMSKDFGYHSSQDSQYHYNYVIVYIDGAYYVGFDYEATGQNPNQQERPNGYYSDWIIKITPANGIITPPTSNDPVVTPQEIIDHVEINFEVEQHKDFVATHLSIHVRAVTDVEVFIPINAKFYCESDDTAIIQKHLDDLMVHNTVYDINGNDVILNITYIENGIIITTNGVNNEIIEYLNEKYNDGITFEVWLYYNEELNRSELKDFLNENIATVKFLDDNPSFYVNAFFFDDLFDNSGEWIGYDKENINPWDCQVIPLNYIQEYNNGYWYNGSPYNQIYKKN